ncbi:MAG: basic amino acid/polyamine antiporter [Christensenella sp.]|uniref:basic amino acid/polyamine antiporter n=1 Tax=Christensenella sp. TaxID=1935934 RepID=UPI002B20C876|nr:basic amino acid/polyamine antiporter [Christensenella sp.]MEA5002814.1 basic amino acid/polyamine antiporter [Christensenella sp.]
MSEKVKSGKLGLPALTAMVIGSMVGAGVFMLPARFSNATGVYGSLIAWLIAGAGMLMLAFVFQALAVRKPKLDAGVFSYARAGFGDYVGFTSAIGFWASACAGNVTYLVLIKSTLGSVFPIFGDGDTLPAILVSSVIIWLFFLLIMHGVQQATLINTIVTIAKIVPIIVFILVAIFYFDVETFQSNLSGNYSGYSLTLFEQVSKTMLITVFVFLGIEGASVYSRYAKNRKIVGSATVLGFLSALCLFMLVAILPFGLLPQETIAAMRQPSMAGVFEAVLGSGGGVFISAGLIISVLGAYLAWTLMSAEVLFAAAKSDDTPPFLKKVNKKEVPQNALLMSALLTQVILIITYFSENALDLALELTSALSLLPLFLTAAYALKITLKKDGYLDVSGGTRKKELVFALIATIYTLFLIWVAGVQYLPLCCLVLAPATILFYRARKTQNRTVFTKAEKIVFAAICLGLIIAIIGLATGMIVI